MHVTYASCKLLMQGGSYLIKRQNCQHVETSQLICKANQLNGFCIMVTEGFNELIISTTLNNISRSLIINIDHIAYNIKH